MSLYEHNGCRNVRYYTKDGAYRDHGRMIYEKVPVVGEAIAPFMGTSGLVKYVVVEVKFPEGDSCMEVYCDDLPGEPPT